MEPINNTRIQFIVKPEKSRRGERGRGAGGFGVKLTALFMEQTTKAAIGVLWFVRIFPSRADLVSVVFLNFFFVCELYH